MDIREVEIGNVVILRLKPQTGIEDDIVGKLVMGSSDMITLENPQLIVVEKGESGRVQVGLASFVPFYAQDKQASFWPSDVFQVFAPQTRLLNEYNAYIGSGIIVPDSKIVTPEK